MKILLFSETSTCLIGDQHAPSDTDMLDWRLTRWETDVPDRKMKYILMGDTSETDMPDTSPYIFPI